MELRTVKAKTVFNKFTRTIRDLSGSQNKKIKLILKGIELDIDKNVADLIIAPLMHIIRNSIDHGIGTPEERKNEGKSEVGKIELLAFVKNNFINICVKDDGKGLNITKIKNKAVENNLIQKEEIEKLSKTQIYNFILEPGFSTADKISEISGRGVGLDVVNNNLKQLGGVLKIESENGKGSSFTLSMPLSISNSKAVEVFSNNNKYLILSSKIMKITKIKNRNIIKYKDKKMLDYRNEIIPFFDINKIVENECEQIDEENLIIIVNTTLGKIGLKINKTGLELDISIKPITGILKDIDFFEGSVIMPNGDVALILKLEQFIINNY